MLADERQFLKDTTGRWMEICDALKVSYVVGHDVLKQLFNSVEKNETVP